MRLWPLAAAAFVPMDASSVASNDGVAAPAKEEEEEGPRGEAEGESEGFEGETCELDGAEEEAEEAEETEVDDSPRTRFAGEENGDEDDAEDESLSLPPS